MEMSTGLVGHDPLEPMILTVECLQPGGLVEAHAAVLLARRR
jgi:hypothetical protein